MPLSDLSAEVLVRKYESQKVFGPFDAERLKRLAANSKLSPLDELSVDGKTWSTAASMGLEFGVTPSKTSGSLSQKTVSVLKKQLFWVRMFNVSVGLPGFLFLVAAFLSFNQGLLVVASQLILAAFPLGLFGLGVVCKKSLSSVVETGDVDDLNLAISSVTAFFRVFGILLVVGLLGMVAAGFLGVLSAVS